METKKTKKLQNEGYSFHGAWISKYATNEEVAQFRARRKELKKQGLDIRAAKLQNGIALYVKRKEE
jgi:hypothetical protein